MIQVIKDVEVLQEKINIPVDNRRIFDKVFDRNRDQIKYVEINGRQNLSDMIIKSTTSIEIGIKFDFETDARKYFGVIPLRSVHDDQYVCVVDFMEDKIQ